MKLRNNFFILRHGETLYQTMKKNIAYPKIDNPSVKLTKKGEMQVKKSANILKKEKINIIYSSDFFRTKQTSRIASKILGIKKIIFDKKLRDLNLGIYRGRPKQDFYNEFPKDSIKRFSERPAEGESWSDCKKRIVNFLKKINKKHKGKNILIVSHGDPLWFLEGNLKNLSNKKLLEFRENNFIKTGEFRKLGM